MAVAKSYQNLEIVKQPYMANGRMYVQVKLGNGNSKQVRWYSDAEYEKYYGVKPEPQTNQATTQKEALGFINGYITIFKGDTFSCKEWFKEHGAKYTKAGNFHWYFPSDMEVPADLPVGVKAVRIDWELVGNGDELKSDEAIKTAIEPLIYEADGSQFQGKIGDRIEVELTVEKAVALNGGYYGPSTMHIMRDANGNAYVWTTASKYWEVGSKRMVRGTIKDHKTYKNVNQTILTRCTEVKEK